MWDKLLHLPISFFKKNSTGNVMSRMKDDISILSQFLSEQLTLAIPSLLHFIGSIILLFYFDWKLSLFSFFLLPLSLLIVFPLGKKIANISEKVQNEKAEYSNIMENIISEILLIKTNSAEKKAIDKGNHQLKNIFNISLKEISIMSLLGPLITTTLIVSILSIISFGIWRLSIGDITIGTLSSMLFILFQLVPTLFSLGNLFTGYKNTEGATTRIGYILDYPSEKDIKILENNIFVPFKQLTFSNVSFEYASLGNILDEINMTFKKGEMVAIVGKSGSGKTSILNLIEKLFYDYSGDIKIDNIDLQDINTGYLRQHISYVTQDSPVLNMSIKENILYGIEKDEKITDENLKEMILNTNLGELLNSSEGENTIINERGNNLSGGQRQRIAIARGLIRKPKILLLDEVTSSLDQTSEGIIMNAVKKISNNIITIVVTHRESTLKYADRVIVIDSGKVVGIGSHNELKENNSFYKEIIYSSNQDSVLLRI